MPRPSKQKTPATAATPMFFPHLFACANAGGRVCVCVNGDNLYHMSNTCGNNNSSDDSGGGGDDDEKKKTKSEKNGINKNDIR